MMREDSSGSGERAEETGRTERRYRASVRLHADPARPACGAALGQVPVADRRREPGGGRDEMRVLKVTSLAAWQADGTELSDLIRDTGRSRTASTT